MIRNRPTIPTTCTPLISNRRSTACAFPMMGLCMSVTAQVLGGDVNGEALSAATTARRRRATTTTAAATATTTTATTKSATAAAAATAATAVVDQ